VGCVCVRYKSTHSYAYLFFHILASIAYLLLVFNENRRVSAMIDQELALTDTYSILYSKVGRYLLECGRANEEASTDDAIDYALELHGMWLDDAYEGDIDHAILSAQKHAPSLYFEAQSDAIAQLAVDVKNGDQIEHYVFLKRILDAFALVSVEYVAEQAFNTEPDLAV